ncbi:hypothetical protein AAF712_012687 [Marasmius tenuissimus]|uniref:Uncharacterized protein n=1 Tax=Marasmius tenuissimus TaxID=585030 RepID=A0ABR2ZH59_9AGAR
MKNSDGKKEAIHDPTSIQHARNLINTSTERNLMVVVGGQSEHIGKLVRQISNFYLASRLDENLWIVVAVIKRDSPTAEERVTPERLELDPKTMLARVFKTDRNRAKFNKVLNPADATHAPGQEFTTGEAKRAAEPLKLAAKFFMCCVDSFTQLREVLMVSLISKGKSTEDDISDMHKGEQNH